MKSYELLDRVRFRHSSVGVLDLRMAHGLDINRPGNTILHIVLSSALWFRFGGSGEGLRIGKGGAILFPQGMPHAIALDEDAPSSRPIEDELPSPPVRPYFRARIGNGARSSSLLSAHGRWEDNSVAGIVQMLPPVMVVPRAGLSGEERLSSLINHLTLEAQLASDPLDNVIVSRLLKIVVLRMFGLFLKDEEQIEVWERTLQSAPIAKAIGLIQLQYSNPLTVGYLARQVNMSRTAFVGRFQEVVGMPPSRYIVRQRMLKAAKILREESTPVKWIAHRVGYESVPTFTQAFRRFFGLTPSAYRASPLDPPTVGATML